MSTINTLAAIAATMLIIIIASISINSHVVRYNSEPIVMTHDDALQVCEDAGLIYDYEATGTTAFELCYE